MPLQGAYEPSPWEPVAEQVALHEAAGGRGRALFDHGDHQTSIGRRISRFVLDPVD